MVLSSRIIPGNEKAIFRMIDHMARRGADVMYGTMNPPLHVSGHGSMEELKLVLNLVRPQILHADPRRIPPAFKHARLAEHLRYVGLQETFIMETGDVLELDAAGARKAGTRHRGPRLHRFRSGRTTWCGEMVIRDRRHAFRRRHRAADHRHQPPHRPHRKPARKSSAAALSGRRRLGFMQGARQVVAKTLEGSNQEEKTDWGVMKEKIRADLKRYISKETPAGR